MVTKTYAVIIAIVLIISCGVRFTLISRLSEAKEIKDKYRHFVYQWLKNNKR